MISYVCDKEIEMITGGLTSNTTNITSVGGAIQCGSYNNNVGQSAVVLNSGDFTINAQAFNKGKQSAKPKLHC